MGNYIKIMNFLLDFIRLTRFILKTAKKIDISFSGITTFIEYKGRLVSWDIQEMIKEAIDLIESDLSKELEE